LNKVARSAVEEEDDDDDGMEVEEVKNGAVSTPTAIEQQAQKADVDTTMPTVVPVEQLRQPHKRKQSTIWPDSSDEEEDAALFAEASRDPTPCFRLWCLLQKRRKEQEQSAGISQYDSAKENTDPRTSRDDNHGEDADSSGMEQQQSGFLEVTRTAVQQQPELDVAREAVDIPDEDNNSSNDDDELSMGSSGPDKRSRTATSSSDSSDEGEERVVTENHHQQSLHVESRDSETGDEDYFSNDSSSSDYGKHSSKRPKFATTLQRRTIATRVRSAPQHRQRDSMLDDSPARAVRRRGRNFFTQEEDDAIMSGYGKYGAQWSLIQRSDPRLSNRSQTDIRCRHRNIVKKQNRHGSA
jgi:Myb-like DNA-binding domain